MAKSERPAIIELCTNDEHGVDTGRVSAIHFGEAIELTWGEIGSEPRYSMSRTDAGYILRLSRKRFHVLGKTEWYGNWCWTAVPMTVDEAVKVFNYLSADDRWHCDGGWCDFTDAYVAGKMTPELIREVGRGEE